MDFVIQPNSHNLRRRSSVHTESFARSMIQAGVTITGFPFRSRGGHKKKYTDWYFSNGAALMPRRAWCLGDDVDRLSECVGRRCRIGECHAHGSRLGV
jgi:hypothetical protein